MPVAKLLLIADENRGGFPKPEPVLDLETRMQAPGLVARLMGLETMPVVHSEKPRKSVDSEFRGDGRFQHSRMDQALCTDVGGSVKGDVRPQKLQRAGRGFLERRPVEAFCKGLIYGPRKKQFMQFETPVKSPRLLPKSGTSRLAQVANKILDPGSQSRSRAKCALTYLGSMEDEREQLSESVGGCCESYGSSLGVKESLAAECGSSASDLSVGDDGIKKINSSVVLCEQRKSGSMHSQAKPKGKEVYIMKAAHMQGRQARNASPVLQAKPNVDSGASNPIERKKHSSNPGDPCGKSVARNSNLRQTRFSPARDKMVSGSKRCITDKSMNGENRFTDFVTSKKNINKLARSKSLANTSGRCGSELVTGSSDKKNRNVEAFVKERSSRSKMMSIKGRELTRNQPVNRSCIESKMPKIDRVSYTERNNKGIVSFTFTSPLRCSSRCTSTEEIDQKKRGYCDLNHHTFPSKVLMTKAEDGSLPSQMEMTMRGDELSSLLEEKIKELSSLDRDELASGDEPQGRSTVSILEDLITVLTVGTPEFDTNADSRTDVSSRTEANAADSQLNNFEEVFEEKIQPETTTSYLAGGSEQPSPVSILEASFSNDSCSMGSFNGSSGPKARLELLQMCQNSHPADTDFELLDSATSSSISLSRENTMTTCKVLGTACEVSSDAELLFENIPLYNSDNTPETSLDSFLLDTVESIMGVSRPNFQKGGKEPKEFLFDCIMECLDSKFSHFCRSGFRTWMKLASSLNRDRLITEVHAEIIGWWELARKAMDDLVTKDMKGSNVHWTECASEVFETGVDIQTDILQALIDEIVGDLH